jgi:hypothetical protein
MKRTLNIGTEPIGTEYRDLLEALSPVVDRALVVVRRSVPLGEKGDAKLASMLPWLIGEHERTQWPGTLLIGGTADVREYRADIACLRLLGELVPGLYSWQQPDAPEDLCLLRRDTSPILVSTAHERDSYLELSPAEITIIEERRSECPNLAIKLRFHARD